MAVSNGRLKGRDLRDGVERVFRKCVEDPPAPDEDIERLKCLVTMGFLLLDNRLQRIAILLQNLEKDSGESVDEQGQNSIPEF